MVEAERQGEHGGVELLLGEIQAAALGLKAAWGLALGLDREAAGTGLLFKGRVACGSRQPPWKSARRQTPTRSRARLGHEWKVGDASDTRARGDSGTGRGACSSASRGRKGVRAVWLDCWAAPLEWAPREGKGAGQRVSTGEKGGGSGGKLGLRGRQGHAGEKAGRERG